MTMDKHIYFSFLVLCSVHCIGAHGDNEHLSLHLGDKFDFDEEGARHLYEHLSEFIDLPENFQNGKFPDDQGRFYFFISHDFDGNNKLDGLECLALLTDFYDSKDPKVAGKLVGNMSIGEVESLVDELLLKHDLDGDGYLDFAEMNNPNIQSVWSQMNKVIEAVEEKLQNDPSAVIDNHHL